MTAQHNVENSRDKERDDTDRYGKVTPKLIFISLSALLGGMLNGLIGAGCGILLIFALDRLLGSENRREVFAISSFTVLTCCAVSTVMYSFAGKIDIVKAPLYIIPGIVGGIAGAALLSVIDPKLLKYIFAAVIIYSGIRMVMA